jgi:hypothetical protein
MPAPVIVNVGGLITVSVGMGSAAVKTLGYTQNGITYVEEGFYTDVPGDENGGDEGPPIEVQYMGEIHRIRAELTKYDSAVASEIGAKVAGATHGVPATAGTLYFASASYMRVQAVGANGHVRNYPYTIPRMPIELNAGTRYSRLVIEFEAHKIPDQTILFTEVAS